MDHNLRYTYHISDDYFTWLRDNGIDTTKFMSNRKNGNYRPTFLCLKDTQNPDILWMVPLSTQYEKYQDKKLEIENKRHKEYIGIVLGQYNGRGNAFLVQNAFPILEKHIDHVHTRNGNPIPVSQPIADEVKNKLHQLRQIRRAGNTKLGFIDIEKIEQLLMRELAASKNTQSVVESKKLEQKQQDEHKKVMPALTSSDNSILKRISDSAKGSMFDSYFSGRSTIDKNQASHFVLRTLAFFSNFDKGAMERIFKNSKLYDGDINKLNKSIGEVIAGFFSGSGSGSGAGSGAGKGRGNGGDNYR